MDEETIRIYEANAGEWAARRAAQPRPYASEFADTIATRTWRIDLGCGPGHYTPDLGAPVVALDAAFEMLELTRTAAPDARCVQADLERLPFTRGSLGGAWARNSYLHVPRAGLPRAFAQLHDALAPDAPFALRMIVGEHEGHALPGDDFPGRFFAFWDEARLLAVLGRAGFTVTDHWDDGGSIHVRATRARTLPDFVGPGLRVLVCGLNPSLHAADAGFGYAGPSNRFWPAATDAGLVTKARDPWWALDRDRVGMTDLVKRATVGAKELRPAEYREGAAEVARLVEWLRPGVVCFVGLAGYRAGVDRAAQPGLQPEPFGGTSAYVLPSTSGLNARTSRAELTDHLRAVARLAPDPALDPRP